ncbi:MAG: S-layer homology domain-containing protein [Oscillospiraceae bacterium]|nr:S-layer homology domain-containing protein [Oscillospiraceae bacterium]
MARITGSPETVVFRLTGTAGSVTLDAARNADTPYYYVKLTAADLISLGESATGTISLLADGVLLSEQNEIFNIPEAEKDPYLIDDFDAYSGSNDLLVREWVTNKDTGCSINLSLDSESSQDGYALKFNYSETKNGWAGATITKEVDWSDCNALQFWTIPDGKQQKTVIQIQANTVYEVYLNLYDGYNARAGQPTLVTIPFSEFCQRDTAGNPKGGLMEDCDSVSSFGLWVNAVENDFLVDGIVNGTIWYDKITAVSSDCTEPVFETPGSTPEPPVSHTFTITASAGTGGSISPSGSVNVEKGADQSFLINAQSGYRISDVKIDGKSVGAVSSYTFSDIAENHTIEAVFTAYSSRPSGNSTKPKPSSSTTPTAPSSPSTPSTPASPTEPSAPPSSPDQPTQTVSYIDVPSGSWYSDAVQYVSERGLMTGTATSTFSPDTAMNRAMLWTILARMSHADTSGGTAWYEKSMAWAVSNGISDGTGALENMTREQMVTMLWRYADSPVSNGSLNQFLDSSMVSPWAADAVRWATDSDLLSGSNGGLNPLGTITRAEAATILMRFCQNTAS